MILFLLFFNQFFMLTSLMTLVYLFVSWLIFLKVLLQFFVTVSLKDSLTRFFVTDFFRNGLLTTPYSVSEGFSNFTSNSRRYLRFLTDFPRLWAAV
jgi:hypothetical protein